MKLKLLFLGAVSAFMFSNVSAQDTIPNLTVDSTLTVGDSAFFSKSVRIDEKMTVKGETFLREDATASKDLKVEGNLFLPGVPTLGEEDADILFVDANGLTLRGGVANLIDRIYSKECSTINGVILNPTWANGPNKLFVACPEVKVGIGTTDPTHQLTNMGDSKFYGHSWFSSTMSLGADADNFSKFYISNQGNGAAIHVNSSGNNGNYNKLLWLEYSNPTTEIIKVTNTTSNYNPFVLTASGNMIINNGTANIFELASDGKLIIRNNTQKNFQFDVTGLFHARRIRVDAENWADFVFEPNYALMPLSEVKSYVSTNKHLPDVPSEKEIIEEGIDLAVMNKILIQKIEELTLYLLQQNETTEELKKEIQELRSQLEALQTTK